MQDDDIIIPPSYKENTGWQSVMNILVGLILGVGSGVFPDYAGKAGGNECLA